MEKRRISDLSHTVVSNFSFACGAGIRGSNPLQELFWQRVREAYGSGPENRRAKAPQVQILPLSDLICITGGF